MTELSDLLQNVTVTSSKLCEPGGSGGLFLPLFGEGEQHWEKNMRAFLYLAGLLYMFMAVNVGSDYFMSAIERITAARKRVHCKERDRRVTKMVWNETVANLSLMALGSSAPEILLSCIEIAGNDFYSGELGPGTIVGSAAFNLLVIIAVCISSIPDGEVRYIKAISVYHCTVLFSVFAYIWLLLIVTVISPDAIEVWEAVVTLVMFFVLIGVCYLADIGKLNCLALERGPPIANDDGAPLLSSNLSAYEGDEAAGPTSDMRSVSTQDPTKHSKGLTPSSVHPRVRRSAQKLHYEPHTIGHGSHDSSGHHRGGKRGSTASTASKVSNQSKMGTLASDQEMPRGTDLDLGEPWGANSRGDICVDNTAIYNPHGIVTFRKDEKDILVRGNDIDYELEVLRRNGSRGKIVVKYSTYSLTAVEGFDFEPCSGELEFEDGMRSNVITLKILGKSSLTRSDAFQIVLEEIEGGGGFNPNDDGDDEKAVFTLNLINDCDASDEVNALDKFLSKCFDIDNLKAARVAYVDQIKNAFLVTDAPEEGEEEEAPGCVDYITHVLSLPFKLLFAVVCPPSELGGGWVLFGLALFWIGLVTALISDLASLFGCCAGLDDSITAITLVALGTSLPDTFASMTSAKQDDHADASIVNVTGSNSVNVYLGIGLPWTIAALYWSTKGEADEKWILTYSDMVEDYPKGIFVVKGEDLGFSVTLFNAIAIICLVLLRIRRLSFGGELGGSPAFKKFSSSLLVFLWLIYIGFSAWKVDSDDAEVATIPLMVLAALSFFAMLISQCMKLRSSSKADSEPLAEDAVPAQQLGKGKKDDAEAIKITVETLEPEKKKIKDLKKSPTKNDKGSVVRDRE